MDTGLVRWLLDLLGFLSIAMDTQEGDKAYRMEEVRDGGTLLTREKTW